MRKLLAPLVLGSTLALGACATNPYGAQYGAYGGSPYGSPYGSGYGSPYGSTGGLGAILGAVLGASGSQGYGSQSFQQAAVNACGSTAARYGQVSIRDVRQVSSSTLRVYGIVGSRYGGRQFACNFRSDGRITDFDI